VADIRVPRQNLTPAPAAPVRPAVRAAQQAFFKAAAGEPVRPAPTARAAQPSAQPAAQPADADPQRPMRPGSFLDIKV
jgi:hypothetical protein